MRTFIILFLLFLQGPMIPFPFVPQAAGGLNPCLLSGWAMNEGTGSVLHDSSSNANTANVFGTAVWGSNSGFPGQSLTMPASVAGATSTTLTNFDGTTPFSLAAWVSITSSAVNQVILSSLNNAGTYNGWEITSESLPTNKLEFSLSNNASGNRIYVNGSTVIIANGIHYVVATYDGSKTAAGVKLYVDGAAETVTVDQNNLTGSAVSGRAAGLGIRPADTNKMSGVLAAAAIYNCVLTPTQVSTYFARGVQVN